MRSLPPDGEAAAPAADVALGAAPDDGSSLHAPTSTQTTIDEHSCTVRFMAFPQWRKLRAPREPGRRHRLSREAPGKYKQRARLTAKMCGRARRRRLARNLQH